MKRGLLNLKRSFIAKQLLLIALLVGASLNNAMAQAGFDYQTRKTGGTWSNYATWERSPAGANTWTALTASQPVPNEQANSITILAGASVTLTSTITVDQLTVDGTLTINYPTTINVVDEATTPIDLLVRGTIVAKGRGGDGLGNITKAIPSAVISFASGSTYKHSYDEVTDPSHAQFGKTAWGMLPEATWDAASTVEINVEGATARTMTNTSIPTSVRFDQSFGNVIWNTPAINANISLFAKLANIKGSFEVRSTGMNTSKLLLNNSASNAYTLNIGQDLKILNTSNVIFAAASATTPAPTADFYLNIGRSLEIISTASFTTERSTNPVQVTFNGTGTISAPNVLRGFDYTISNTANITLLSTFAVPGGTPANIMNVNGVLNTGANNLYGNGTLNLNNNATLGIGAQTGINANITVLNTNYSPLANFIYNGTNPQITGTNLPLEIGGLVINNPFTVTLSNNTRITNLLSLQNGILQPASKKLTIVESPSLIVNGNNTSYVDGAISYEAVVTGAANISKNMTFPIGKNNVYRPITLSLDQTTIGTNTYTASQVETALSIAPANYPGEIDAVSDKRHYVISLSGTASVANAFVTLAFSADEVVSNTEMRIIKSNGSAWMDLGGAPEGSSNVKSNIPFTSFSQFAIAYKNVSPLPVELISFKAVKAENAVNVLWATASEKNNAYFAVERSADGKNFAAIGQVEGAGTTSATKNYSFLDKNPLNNVSYYRLKQVDLDGTFEYSEIVKVMVNNRVAGLSLTAFPNPTAANVNVQISGLNGAATLQVLDMTGRLVAIQEIANGTANAEVNLANVPAGLYNVKLVSAEGTTFLKVIKK